MGSVLFLGDTHFHNHRYEGGELVGGVNRRCRELLSSVERTVALAVSRHDVTDVVQVGDYFDQCRPPAPVVEACIRMMKASGLRWHLLRGNHDAGAFGVPSALAPLAHIEGIHVYEDPEQVELGGMRVAMIPYISHSTLEALEMALYAIQGVDKIVMHYGVVDTATRPDQVTERDIFRFLAKRGVRANQDVPSQLVISGHEHGARSVIRHRPYSQSRAIGSYADLDWSAVNFSNAAALVVGFNDGVPLPSRYYSLRVKGPAFQKVPDGSTIQELLVRALNSQGAGLYLDGTEKSAPLLSVLRELNLIQGYRVQGVAVDSEPGKQASEEGFASAEEVIAEVLERSGADLAEDSTQRVWAQCLDHIRER